MEKFQENQSNRLQITTCFTDTENGPLIGPLFVGKTYRLRLDVVPVGWNDDFKQKLFVGWAGENYGADEIGAAAPRDRPGLQLNNNLAVNNSQGVYFEFTPQQMGNGKLFVDCFYETEFVTRLNVDVAVEKPFRPFLVPQENPVPRI